MSIHVPDYKLEPPGDDRKEVYECALCRDPILEGDDYYLIPSLGPCCESCIDECKKFEAELPDCGYDEGRDD